MVTTTNLGVARDLDRLSEDIDGDVRYDELHRLLYAQDASVYSEEPLGVVYPRSREDIQAIVRLAGACGIPLIPRGGGTSLAGQCVGPGLVVDVGRHMTRILEVDEEEGWVRVEPGVVLDQLNDHLARYDLFFGPDTSTSNRCMIGGMIGNNSCGSHSIKYGNTRRHLLELGVVFSDGSWELLKEWDSDELAERMNGEGALAAGLRAIDTAVRENGSLIRERYPAPDVIRRNTGYAFDDVLDRVPYADQPAADFSLPRFLCGSEGTLGITTEAKLNVVPKWKENILVCPHFDSLMDALKATVVAVSHDPSAVELIDRRILEQTKNNLEQQRNRFFVEGDPEGVLVIEFYTDTREEAEEAARALIEDLESRGMGYSHPIVRPPKDENVWALRKAGLGILMGIPGDTKPVSVVEDTAVPVGSLPNYIGDFMELMEAHGTESVYHAHASVGELHLRPELNLKDEGDVEKFVKIAEDVTDLVVEYRGSLSGEHGDGRVRAPLLPRFYGDDVYELHRDVKTAFDPRGIFNPGKIVDPKPMDDDFRFPPGEPVPEFDTYLDWSSDLGLMRAVEKCNGAGTCRKRAEAGGTMCPSYMATLDEKDTTRGRANVFRQLLMRGPDAAWRSEELNDALDLCLSCKGCKSECPANVDMARMKAEFLQHRHDEKGTPLSAYLFGYYRSLSRLAAVFPALANFIMSFALTRWLLGVIAGIAPQRVLPGYATRFGKQFRRRAPADLPADAPVVWLYVDPFTEFTDPHVAMAAVDVLEAAGRRVEILPVEDDGRTFISKGMLRRAKRVANEAIRIAGPLVAEYPDRPIVGLEPSALLTFRDEIPDLVDESLREDAREVAERCLLFDEYVARELDAERFDVAWTSPQEPRVVLHGHCHQKALVGTKETELVLSRAGYDVETLETGCCGMAGSFGYEKDHYDLSMQIGELVLFPAVRDCSESDAVSAPGTSCRHQIADGTGREAEHPAVLLQRRLPDR